MIPRSYRLTVQSLNRFNDSTAQWITVALVAFLLMMASPAQSQFSLPEEKMARSVSGQFFVIAPQPPSRLSQSKSVLTNTELVELDPTLLTVSTERVKEMLGHELNIKPDGGWRGKIYLVIHPAQSLDDPITIVSKQTGNWSYQMQLPDVVPQSKFVRAMASVLLMEMANRHNDSSRSAEIPAWLADGMSQQLIAENLSQMILSPPQQVVHGLPMTRTDVTKRGYDPLADTRKVLQNHPALTFEQLSWPNDAQLLGDDEGVYHASAQLFLHELLDLRNGDLKLRAMLDQLPAYYNWQTAFQNAFRDDFENPLAVEKWWALQVVAFNARDPGSRWTAIVSRDKLDEILRVPVAVRVQSNSLPTRTDVSLQVIIRNFEPEQRTTILQTKLRDLQLAQLRMASPLAMLTDNYRVAIADFLGQDADSTVIKKRAKAPSRATVDDLLKRLDELDARRREIVATIQPERSFQPRIEPKFQLNAAQ